MSKFTCPVWELERRASWCTGDEACGLCCASDEAGCADHAAQVMKLAMWISCAGVEASHVN